MPEVQNIVREVLGREDLPPLILLNANSGDLLPLRTWSPDRYIELARRLLEHYPDVAIAFTGSPEEAKDAWELATKVNSDRCISMGGKTRITSYNVCYTKLLRVVADQDLGRATIQGQGSQRYRQRRQSHTSHQ